MSDVAAFFLSCWRPAGLCSPFPAAAAEAHVAFVWCSNIRLLGRRCWQHDSLGCGSPRESVVVTVG